MVEFTVNDIIGENKFPIQKKIEIVESLLMNTNRQGSENMLDFFRKSDFYTAPASSKYHSNYEGGLLDHTLLVYSFAMALRQPFIEMNPEFTESLNPVSITIAALIHDLCKVNFYQKVDKWAKDDHNNWVSYTGYTFDDPFPVGHGEKSIIMSQIIKFDLTVDEMLAIRYHMGFWGGETNQELKSTQAKAIEKTPLVLLLQMADYAASQKLEITIKH